MSGPLPCEMYWIVDSALVFALSVILGGITLWKIMKLNQHKAYHLKKLMITLIGVPGTSALVLWLSFQVMSGVLYSNMSMAWITMIMYTNFKIFFQQFEDIEHDIRFQ